MDADQFDAIARRAAQRYARVSMTAMNFARGKMAGDPVYRHALLDGLLPSHGTLVDIGCGQGIFLALLDEAARFDRLIGVEMRPRMAFLARQALDGKVEIIEGDARSLQFGSCSAAVLFDVLQMMSPLEQEQLLSTLISALEPGGVLLVREADASSGWRFRLVSMSNQIKARLIGTWRQRRHYRSREAWLECFARLGLSAEVCEAPTRNPLGNILFRAQRP
jgi:SAM-dependent methyltransferase